MIKRLWPHARPYLPLILCGVVCAAAEAVFELLIPLVMSDIVDIGIKNGDVKMIKNAGGMIMGPFDSAVRSLLVGIIELGVEEVMVIGHTDCGVAHINADMMINHLIQRGISQDHIDMMRYCGIDFQAWLRGFDCVEFSVSETVDMLRNHPLMPQDVTIKGYIIDTETGELTPQN